jgi:hypothetical protein
MSIESYSIEQLMEKIRQGQLMLPNLQRRFVWRKESKITLLFDSVLRGFPIQSILLWRTREPMRARRFNDFVELGENEPRASATEFMSDDSLMVLDGQQRIQSLAAIFLGGILQDGILMPARFRVGEPLGDAAALREPRALTFKDEPGAVPVARIISLLKNRTPSEVARILQEQHSSLRDKTQELIDNVSRLFQAYYRSSVRAELLDGITGAWPYEAMLQVFVRINSGGTPLTREDLVYSRIKEDYRSIDDSVEEFIETLRVDGFSLTEATALRCLLASEGATTRFDVASNINDSSAEALRRLESNKKQTSKAIQSLVHFMKHDLKISSLRSIPSEWSLPAIYAYLYGARKRSAENSAKAASFFYLSIFCQWRTSELAGLNRVVELVRSAGDECPIEKIKSHFKTQGHETSLSNDILDRSNLEDVILGLVYLAGYGHEPHDVSIDEARPEADHIFPKSPLRTQLQLGSAEINDIGNLCFIPKSENRAKRAERPAEWFSRLKASGKDISPILLVPRFADDPSKLDFNIETYRSFVSARRIEMMKIIRTRCGHST